ncbi:MAG: replication-associated recombination protein A [Candidatus Omnitrophota bacterium]
MRPTTLQKLVGQKHLLGKGKLLQRIMCADRLQSAILFGPSGTGKTTLGYIIAQVTQSRFEQLNAVKSNASELRKVLDKAKQLRKINPATKTILFVDEFHRFNKAQQDILMPDVEQGDIILLGATTHNPSFSVNGPLLSRSLIFEFKPLDNDDVLTILKEAIHDTHNGFGNLKIDYTDDALRHIVKQASGDARRALNALEIGVLTTESADDGTIYFNKTVAEECVQKKIVYYDHDEDYHYDTISAFIKSMRGSDPDASIYWLAKMLYAGEEPLFIARRIVIFASEDISNADPHALLMATSALQALEFVGMPEGRIILAHAVTYMAAAPKSNASYMAIEEALSDVEHETVEEVPTHLRDKSYPNAKRLERGEGYKYPHNFDGGYVVQKYTQNHKNYYKPSDRGYEKTIKQRLENLKKYRTD